jgi:hypothetical protein
MEQAVDSPITTDQREGCIAELKRDNSRDLSMFKLDVCAVCLLPLSQINSWFLSIGEPKSARDYVTFACIALVVAGACYAVAAWAVLHWIAETMRRYAAEVFTQTQLVNHVLGLPSDVQAYRGRIRAAFVGEWLTFKKERFDARRRAKAIIMRFGTWCRRFHRLSELWAVGGALYIFGGTLILDWVAFIWLTSQTTVRQQIEHSQFFSFSHIGLGFVASLLAVSVLFDAVLRGRCIGTRLALIDYFTAEAARHKSASAAADNAARAQAALVAAAEAKLSPLSRET